MSDFREHARNHLRTVAGTYIWAVLGSLLSLLDSNSGALSGLYLVHLDDPLECVGCEIFRMKVGRVDWTRVFPDPGAGRCLKTVDMSVLAGHLP